ncbi:hypothetical protein DEF24_25040, partial [Marinitenerispora sediminis]
MTRERRVPAGGEPRTAGTAARSPAAAAAIGALVGVGVGLLVVLVAFAWVMALLHAAYSELGYLSTRDTAIGLVASVPVVAGIGAAAWLALRAADAPRPRAGAAAGLGAALLGLLTGPFSLVLSPCLAALVGAAVAGLGTAGPA